MQKAHEDLNRHGLATGPLVPGKDDPEEESAWLASLFDSSGPVIRD